MFLPIVLDFENNGLKFMLLKYLRFLDMCINNDWAIISHEEFEKYELNFPNRNEYKEQMMKLYRYSIHDMDERKNAKQFFVPKSFFDNLENRTGSKLESALYLLNSRDAELEDILEGFIKELLDDGEQIEGILYFAACPLSVKYIAEKYQIPMIAYETGPIRTPNYRCLTSYFCNDGLYTTEEIERRYNQFKKEVKAKKIPIFSREELLYMFVNDDSLGYISLIDKTPKYEIGVAGGCAIVVPYFAINKYMDHELIDDVLDTYKLSDIQFRLHPGDIYKASYRLHHYDATPEPFAFLINSKRVAAVGSNLLFEAMLWKRIPCSKTKVMPACLMSNESYLAEREKEDAELFVNFFIFSFLVPFDFAYDSDYMSWRLSNPSEEEIYMKNLLYYMKTFALNEEWLYLDSKKRLNLLIAYRGGKTFTIDELEEKTKITYTNPQNTNNVYEKVYVPIEKGEKNTQISQDEMFKKYQDTKQHLDDVLNSRAWKITAPLRKILDFFKGNKKKNN